GHTMFSRDWSSDVCSSDLKTRIGGIENIVVRRAALPAKSRFLFQFFHQITFQNKPSNKIQPQVARIESEALIRSDVSDSMRFVGKRQAYGPFFSIVPRKGFQRKVRNKRAQPVKFFGANCMRSKSDCHGSRTHEEEVLVQHEGVGVSYARAGFEIGQVLLYRFGFYPADD